jgi:hypothetical protein
MYNIGEDYNKEDSGDKIYNSSLNKLSKGIPDTKKDKQKPAVVKPPTSNSSIYSTTPIYTNQPTNTNQPNYTNQPIYTNQPNYTNPSITTNMSTTHTNNNNNNDIDLSNNIAITETLPIANEILYTKGVVIETNNNNRQTEPIIKIITIPINPSILDPLTVIIKLAIISNKENGVKICIQNNTLFIHDKNILQPIIRYYYKIDKTDIQYLYNPIEIACKTFLTTEYKQSHPNILHLFICSQKGILKLMETYKTDTLVNICLKYYYSLISNYLDAFNDPPRLFNIDLFKPNDMTELYNKLLLQKLNSQWVTDKLNLVLEMTEYLYKHDNSVNSIQCVEAFLLQVDSETIKNIGCFNESKS